MAGVKVTVEGAAEAAKMYASIKASLAPDKRRTLVVNLAVLALAEEASYFRSATSPDGIPWAPLSRTTLLRRKHGGNRPLQDRGILRLSVSAGAGPVLPAAVQASTSLGSVPEGGVREVSADGFAIGTRLVYGATHQYGRGRIKARVRPFVRRVKSRDIRGRAKGIGFVRGHDTTLPAVTARPFVGYSPRLIDRMTRYSAAFVTRTQE